MKINTQKTIENVTEAVAEVAEILHEDILENIQSPIYDWPRETRRKKTGKIVGSPRDIVDFGLDSQDSILSGQKVEVDGLNIKFKNTSKHSDIVHNGGVSSLGNWIPARPFITDTLDNVNKAELIAKLMKKNATTDKNDRTRLRNEGGQFVKDKGIGDVNIDVELGNPS